MSAVGLKPPRGEIRVGIVSPFAEGGDTYPHVGYVAISLRRHAEVEWVTISERGFRIDRLIDETLLAGNVTAFWHAIRKLAADWWAVRSLAARCDVLVAVDFMALVIAANVSKKPIVFWSHDYITSDEERYWRKINRLWTWAIRRALVQHRNLIIQDEDRARSLVNALAIEPETPRTFFLPVSLPRARGEGKEEFERVSKQKPTVMQIGGINAWRSYTNFLLDQYSIGYEKFDVILHGIFGTEILSQIKSLHRKPVISDGFIPFEKIPEIVGKCTIGFVGYRPTDEIFFLIRNASGQLVEFLRCGKPVLVMGINNLGELLESKRAGRVVRNSEDFFTALEEVSYNYQEFSHNASSLFDEMYNLDRYELPLCAFLQATARTGGVTHEAI